MKKLIPLLFCIAATLYAKEQHPITKVNAWFKEEQTRTTGTFHKFATLATVSRDGHPHTRMIELVGLNPQQGGLFFTHKNSEKVKHLEHSSHAALNIWLPQTHRQISIDGVVSQISEAEAEKSWNRMPRFMKITFMASTHQGEISSNEVLEERKKQLEELYPKEILMPGTFVGYRILPQKVIFYEIQSKSFPIKHIALIGSDDWSICQVEP